MAEIPIHVLTPPDKIPHQKEDAWRERQDPGGLRIQIPPDTGIPQDLVTYQDKSLQRADAYLPHEEQERIQLFKRAREEARVGNVPLARRLTKDAMRKDENIYLSYELIRMTISHAREIVEEYIQNKRQDQWGDPGIPDLGLDFEAYESMPDDAIIEWARSLGLEVDKLEE